MTFLRSIYQPLQLPCEPASHPRLSSDQKNSVRPRVCLAISHDGPGDPEHGFAFADFAKEPVAFIGWKVLDIEAAHDLGGSLELIAAGEGTERVESSLKAALPGARMARVDRDSTRKRGSAEKIFEQAAKGELDILVGTQMLSKGHDFPNITLVGVINSDGAIFSADFRAAERLAAQMMQVAGRAGRAQLPGRVLIQTRFPDHPVYQAIAAQNYAQFAAIALKEREASHLPPYAYLAMLRAESRDSQMLADFMAGAAKLAASTNNMEKEVQVWDPVPPTLARKAGFERRQLMVQATSRKALQQFLTAWLPLVGDYQAIEKLRNIKWIIDVDPQDV